MHRRTFLATLAAVPLAATPLKAIWLSEPAPSFTERILRSLDRRTLLGFQNGMIVLSREGQLRLSQEHVPLPVVITRLAGVPITAHHELHGDEFWIVELRYPRQSAIITNIEPPDGDDA